MEGGSSLLCQTGQGQGQDAGFWPLVPGGPEGCSADLRQEGPCLNLFHSVCGDTICTMIFATSQEGYGNPKDAQILPPPRDSHS
jgi:hypothetical protein